MSGELFDTLKNLVGKNGFLEAGDVGAKYYTDPRGTGIKPAFVLRPSTTRELSGIMELCHAAAQPVVAQGGMTGLVAGGKPLGKEIPISFERMNRVEELDARTNTITAQSGTPLQTIQDHADQHDLLFPLDLGSRGSCTIGGNLATNAGGNRVIRYGMARDLVLGVEAVLADGTIVSSMNKFVKNNAGYDLKQLFIGSEGTLGLITRATLRLHRKSRSQIVGFCAAPGFDAVVGFMHHMQSAMGGNLSAFEVMWTSIYHAIIDAVPTVKAPLPRDYPFYILVEVMGGRPEHDQDLFETTLNEALEKGLIVDAVVSKSQSEVDDLWRVRDGMAEAMSKQQSPVGFDISLSIGDMEVFAAEIDKRLAASCNGVRHFIGGHLGDGNLHLVVAADASDPPPREQIEALVYGLTGELNGSISAEHGIGTLKRPHLHQSRNPAELALMRTLKRSLDPKCLLNPGRIFEMPGAVAAGSNHSPELL